MIRYKYAAMLFCTLLPLLAAAQPASSPEMADTMRSNGKIYIVVAVCLTILVGLFLYVAALDRKIRKMEKENRGM
jgi:CcmD family protein